MKKRAMKLSALLLTSVLTAGMLTANVSAEEQVEAEIQTEITEGGEGTEDTEGTEVLSGTLGDNNGISWTYDEATKTLTITGEDSGFYSTNIGIAYPGMAIGYVSPFYDLCPEVEKLIVQDCTPTGSMYAIFSHLYELKSVEFINFDTSNVTDMSNMFECCTSLESLDVSSFDTANVTNMEAMFSTCRSLKSLDVSSFDTSNVTNMVGMFMYCEALESINLEGIVTSNVTNMRRMFMECSSLQSIDVSGFDTVNVTDMGALFNECSSLQSLDVSGFVTDNVTEMDWMFDGCSSLQNLDVSNFVTDNVTNMNGLFENCSSLQTLDVSALNTSNVTEMGWMFYGCSGLKSLDISTLDTTNVTNMMWMFSGCKNLESIDVSTFKTSNVTNMEGMFDECASLESVDISALNTSNVTKMNSFFRECTNLESVNWGTIDTSNVKEMGWMFDGCSNLTTMDISVLDVSSLCSTRAMFRNCTNLKSVDMSGLTAKGWTDVRNMFENCSNLESVDFSDTEMMYIGFSENTTDVFLGCENLTTIHTPKVIDIEEGFYLPGVYCDAEISDVTALSADNCNRTLIKQTIEAVESEAELTVGNEKQLLLDIGGVTRDASINTNYTWTVDSEDVLAVSETGVVTGVGMGKATVTCEHKSDATLTATYEIEIETPFSDIKVTDWQYPYVVYAYENNLMSGKGEGKFDMNGNITRSEFVTVLYSHSEKPEVTFSNDFSDVASNDWFADAVTWAKQEGVTAGNPDGTFGSYNNITREQLVAMLYQYAIKKGVAEEGAATADLSTYADTDKVSTWATEAFEWAVENNIIGGKVRDGVSYLAPQEKTTRGECATMMMRYVELAK